MHGLFGVNYLKHHNFRSPEWAADDLIAQYDRLSNIYRKANNVANMQNEQDETRSIENYRNLVKEVKYKKVLLHKLLKGDLQRTKNVLQDHPLYQKMYQGKQSYEVLDELNRQTFLKQKKLDQCTYELNELIKHYENRLVFTIFNWCGYMLMIIQIIYLIADGGCYETGSHSLL